MQECAITIPDVFLDRTMDLFALNDAGASEFTFVVSRAMARVDDTLQSVSRRLVSELNSSLQSFELINTQMTEIDGLQSVELFYRFKSGEGDLFQKQRVVLTNEKNQGKKLLFYWNMSKCVR